MSWSELQRLFQLFVFESMTLTTVDENGCIKAPDPHSPTPWNNPVEYTKHLYWNNRLTPGVTRVHIQPLQLDFTAILNAKQTNIFVVKGSEQNSDGSEEQKVGLTFCCVMLIQIDSPHTFDS